MVIEKHKAAIILVATILLSIVCRLPKVWPFPPEIIPATYPPSMGTTPVTDVFSQTANERDPWVYQEFCAGFGIYALLAKQ